MPAQPKYAWFVFVVAAICAWLFSAYGWQFGWYVQGMCVLLVLNLCVAAWVLSLARRKAQAAGVLVLGLLFANFGLVEMAAMVTIWSVNGSFAP